MGGKNFTPGDYLQFVKYQKKAQEKAPGPSIFWRPLPDLNRCRRRERAVSWAGLDEGDV